MKTPNVPHAKMIPFNMPAEWAYLGRPELILKLEGWATENLPLKHAAAGSYMREGTNMRSTTLGQFWIVRHSDYDTGRLRFEVQLREITNGETFVWDAKDDRLTMSRLAQDMVFEEHTRVGEDLQWFKVFHLQYNHFDLSDAPPAVRELQLFDQCWDLGKELSNWLAANIRVIRRRGEEPETANPALLSFLKTNIVHFAGQPEYLEKYKAYLNDPSLEHPGIRHTYMEVSKWREKLRRSNRIATPEQLALYHRLKTSVDELKGTSPEERPIHASNLVGIQTKWINICSGPIESFLK